MFHSDNLVRDLNRRSSRPREPLEIRREPIGGTVPSANSLTIKVVRDGRICALTLIGDLDTLAVPRFQMHAAQIIDEPTERFVLDLAGLTFLDCAGARALAAVTNSLPSGCPVIIRSLSPAARRILDLLDLGLRQGLSAGPEHHDTPVRREGSRLTSAE